MHHHVAVQVANLFESFATNRANVRPLVHMSRGDVRLQIRFPHERGFAHVALERSHVRVNGQVRLKYVLVLEILLAQMALERPLVVVHLFVNGQVGKLLEHFRTDLALIGASVLVGGAHVPTQRVRQSVPLAANFTAERTFVRVGHQVSVQVPLLEEPRAAHVALVRFLTVVNVHVFL